MARVRVLLIAYPNSYRVAAFLNAATQLDVEIIIASEGKYSLSPQIAAGIHVELSNVADAFETIVKQLVKVPVNAIFSPDDSCVELAAQLAQHFGFHHNTVESGRITRRKDLARQCLQASSLLTPAFALINVLSSAKFSIKSLGLNYPVVLKPLAMSGSRGVIRADNDVQLNEACERIQRILEAESIVDEFERSHILVEEYISGNEYVAEGLLDKGELKLISLFSKPDPLEGPYFEETYYISPSNLTAYEIDQVTVVLHQVCQIYGLCQGPIHAEFRLNDNGVWLIELASRTIGGECAQLIEMQTGETLEAIVLANLLNLDFDYQIELNKSAVGVLMIPMPNAGVLRRVEGIKAAQEIPGIESVQIAIQTGYELVPLPEGSCYLGFIFARGEKAEQVEKSLRLAHSCLNIVVNQLISVRRK